MICVVPLSNDEVYKLDLYIRSNICECYAVYASFLGTQWYPVIMFNN